MSNPPDETLTFIPSRGYWSTVLRYAYKYMIRPSAPLVLLSASLPRTFPGYPEGHKLGYDRKVDEEYHTSVRISLGNLDKVQCEGEAILASLTPGLLDSVSCKIVLYPGLDYMIEVFGKAHVHLFGKFIVSKDAPLTNSATRIFRRMPTRQIKKESSAIVLSDLQSSSSIILADPQAQDRSGGQEGVPPTTNFGGEGSGPVEAFQDIKGWQDHRDASPRGNRARAPDENDTDKRPYDDKPYVRNNYDHRDRSHTAYDRHSGRDYERRPYDRSDFYDERDYDERDRGQGPHIGRGYQGSYDGRDRGRNYDERDRGRNYDRRDRGRSYDDRDRGHGYDDRDRGHNYNGRDYDRAFDARDRGTGAYGGRGYGRDCGRDYDDYDGDYREEEGSVQGSVKRARRE